MIDEKNFLFSKIKNELKDEYKILYDLRTMPNEPNPLQDLIEKYSKILAAFSIAIIILPTVILLSISPSYNLFVWFLLEIGICVIGMDHFTHRFTNINTEIKSNHSA